MYLYARMLIHTRQPSAMHLCTSVFVFLMQVCKGTEWNVCFSTA